VLDQRRLLADYLRGPLVIRSLAASLAVCLSLTLAGCQESARQRPMGMGAVDQGASSLESVRRQLTGTWELVALELAPKPGAPRVPVAATGVLTYDEYANLTIDAKTTGPAAPVAAREVNMLSFKGRAAIDPVKKELRLQNLSGNANPDEVLLPNQRRLFEVTDETLKLSVVDEKGDISAVTSWKRRR
jgi:hypothetical protein